jgi:biopolymer transport protein ExbB
MEGRKMGQIGRIAYAGLAMAFVSTPAFAQEGGGLDLVEMFEQMGSVAMGIAVVLFIMSFWSVGVAIERIYTFAQAKKQSKLYAPQVAKHLKEGRLKEAIALSSNKEYRYSHLAKVVLAGLQEYQFQQESGSNLSREDVLDTVRRSIQRATALTSNDLKKGVSGLATIGATAPFVGLFGTVWGIMNSFIGISEAHTTNLAVVAPGIAEALLATALGLVAAIPAVVIYNHLTRTIAAHRALLGDASAMVLLLISREGDRGSFRLARAAE